MEWWVFVVLRLASPFRRLILTKLVGRSRWQRCRSRCYQRNLYSAEWKWITARHWMTSLSCSSDSLVVTWIEWSNNQFDVFIFHLPHGITTEKRFTRDFVPCRFMKSCVDFCRHLESGCIFDVFFFKMQANRLPNHKVHTEYPTKMNLCRFARGKKTSFIAAQLEAHTRRPQSEILIVSRFYFKTANIKTMSHLGHDTQHSVSHRERAWTDRVKTKTIATQ